MKKFVVEGMYSDKWVALYKEKTLKKAKRKITEDVELNGDMWKYRVLKRTVTKKEVFSVEDLPDGNSVIILDEIQKHWEKT